MNNLVTLLACAIPALSLSLLNAQSTVGYWRMGDDGTFTNDSSSFNNDLSFNANTGNEAPLTVGSGNASDFPGTIPQTGTSNDDAYFIGGADNWQVADQPEFSSNAYTFELYTSPNVNGAFNVVAMQGDFGADLNFRLGYNTSGGGGMTINISDGNGLGNNVFNSGSFFSGGLDKADTHYMAWSFKADSANGFEVTFFHKNLTDSTSLVSTTLNDVTITDLFDSTDPLFIAAQDSAGTNGLAGELDEIRFSDDALSQSQLLTTVPEPGTYALTMAVGALGLTWFRRRCS